MLLLFISIPCGQLKTPCIIFYLIPDIFVNCIPLLECREQFQGNPISQGKLSDFLTKPKTNSLPKKYFTIA